jgi:hypothetical protein
MRHASPFLFFYFIFCIISKFEFELKLKFQLPWLITPKYICEIRVINSEHIYLYIYILFIFSYPYYLFNAQHIKLHMMHFLLFWYH